MDTSLILSKADTTLYYVQSPEYMHVHTAKYYLSNILSGVNSATPLVMSYNDSLPVHICDAACAPLGAAFILIELVLAVARPCRLPRVAGCYLSA